MIYAKMGLGTDQTIYKDLDINKFRHIIDYLLSYNSNPIPAPQ